MKVGILGGGQLGLMLAESLHRLDADVLVLEPDAQAPCAVRLPHVVAARLDDAAALGRFFSEVSCATYDSENVPAGPLAPFARQLKPSLRVLQVSQHRAREKRFVQEAGFAPVRFAVVDEGQPLAPAVRAFGLPCLVKSCLGGYDGKSQFKVEDEASLALLPASAPGGWVLEEVLRLDVELSCIVARGEEGPAVAFPVFENAHRAHILDVTVVPARVPAAVQDEARRVALGLAQALDVRGLLTVEFFLGAGRDGVQRLYVNELAPRVHNSGHVTRRACTVSQFDALARVLLGVPVVPPELLPGGWAMGQLLGEVWLAQGRQGGALDLTAWQDFPDVVEVYLYGKAEARPARKMGHFLVHGPSVAVAEARALAFREALLGRGRAGQPTPGR